MRVSEGIQDGLEVLNPGTLGKTADPQSCRKVGRRKIAVLGDKESSHSLTEFERLQNVEHLVSVWRYSRGL